MSKDLPFSEHLKQLGLCDKPLYERQLKKIKFFIRVK